MRQSPSALERTSRGLHSYGRESCHFNSLMAVEDSFSFSFYFVPFLFFLLFSLSFSFPFSPFRVLCNMKRWSEGGIKVRREDTSTHPRQRQSIKVQQRNCNSYIHLETILKEKGKGPWSSTNRLGGIHVPGHRCLELYEMQAS